MKANCPTTYCTSKQIPEPKDKGLMYCNIGPDTVKPGITGSLIGFFQRERQHLKNHDGYMDTVCVFDKIQEAKRAEACMLNELRRKSTPKYRKEYYPRTSKKSIEAILKYIIKNHPAELVYKITPEPIEGVWKAPWGIFEVFSDGSIEFGGVKYTSRTIAKYLKKNFGLSMTNNRDIRDFLFDPNRKRRFERIR